VYERSFIIINIINVIFNIFCSIIESNQGN